MTAYQLIKVLLNATVIAFIFRCIPQGLKLKKDIVKINYFAVLIMSFIDMTGTFTLNLVKFLEVAFPLTQVFSFILLQCYFFVPIFLLYLSMEVDYKLFSKRMSRILTLVACSLELLIISFIPLSKLFYSVFYTKNEYIELYSIIFDVFNTCFWIVIFILSIIIFVLKLKNKIKHSLSASVMLYSFVLMFSSQELGWAFNYISYILYQILYINLHYQLRKRALLWNNT